ncbi:MAG: 3-deoxy-D-manno-octulosonic acid transferase, partial [Bacteroidia bacterium]|nr:3-deoxy-D-manno-octulosonic acid transferase [Bacteroidia bacterium]
FNSKIKKGVKGRNETFSILKSKLKGKNKTIWFHCASLGEYEQGLPVFEEIRKLFPKYKIILTFFSPSGYEIRKNAPIADIVTYLPIDTKHNAQTFIDLINPELVVFVKYEIWPNYLNILNKRKTKTILISAMFRKNQLFFKPYGRWMLKLLHSYEHIFVQNNTSKTLLEEYGFKNVSVSGDTRFDRVFNQLKIDNTLDFIEEFKGDKLCFVAGSTWPEGEYFISKYINTCNTELLKFIIAPHNIKTKQIEKLRNSISKKVVLYSEKEKKNLNEFDVLIIDTIGLLSKIYSYADIAYVGGALGNTGLHNTLEPAIFGVPIIIGNHFKKFPEAIEMLQNGGLFSVPNQDQFDEILNKLVNQASFRLMSGQSNIEYIKKNQGAVIQIINFLRK